MQVTIVFDVNANKLVLSKTLIYLKVQGMEANNCL